MREALRTARFESTAADRTPIGAPPPGRLRSAGLKVGQIEAGIAALAFDPVLLARSSTVTLTREAKDWNRVGILLCVDATPRESVWTMLTRSGPSDSLMLDTDWRTGGNWDWRNKRLFVADAAALARGPKETFALASWREGNQAITDKARLSKVGLAAVRLWLGMGRGRL
jgi:hypothetical protein